MNSLLENIQVDAAIVSNTTSSALYSQSFSMAGYSEAAAVIQVGPLLTTGSIVRMAILGGDATTVPASMSSIANAEIVIGTSSTSGYVYGAHKIRINCMGSAAATIATGVSLVIGGVTFVSSTVGDSTNMTFLAGLASVAAHSLTTLLQTVLPQLNTTYGTTGAATIAVDVELNNIKQDTTALSARTTIQSTISGLNVIALKTVGMISMKVPHLMATASSFTNFCIRVSCTDSSTIPVSVVVFRDAHYQPNQIAVGHRRDLTTSVLI
jgi:hypothetical protein